MYLHRDLSAEGEETWQAAAATEVLLGAVETQEIVRPCQGLGFSAKKVQGEGSRGAPMPCRIAREMRLIPS